MKTRFSAFTFAVMVVAGIVLAKGSLNMAIPAYGNGRPDSLAQAIKAYNDGRAAEAIPVLAKHADGNNRDALFYLGRAYFEGKGTEVDLTKAANAFSRASELGDINAPVWAGMAFEAINQPAKAAEFHMTALEHAPHLTSLLALGRFHRQQTIPNANALAAVRYLGLAQSIYDAIPAPKEAQDYLSSLSCFELVQGVFVEEQHLDEAIRSIKKLSNLIPDFIACSASGDMRKLRGRLVSAAGLRLKQTGKATFDPGKTMASYLQAESPSGLSLLPSPFRGMVAFASDADSDQLDSSISGQRFLNDYLGLPIANSIFPMTFMRGVSTPVDGSKWNPKAALYSSLGDVERNIVEGLPAYLLLARAWHRGRYDHLHSWYDNSQSMLLRSDATLSAPISIPMIGFFESLRPEIRQAGQVIRLYFSAQPPEDLRIHLKVRGGATVDVNVAQLMFHQRKERDEGEIFHVVVLRLPAKAPLFDIPEGHEIPLVQVEEMIFASPSCGSACPVRLEKVEIGTFDRFVAIEQARVLQFLNMRPYGYTSHGGEGWHVHGDPGMLTAYWANVKMQTAAANVVHSPQTFTMANIPESKGYIEDLLSEVGVRAVRPERLPSGLPPMGSVHDWREAPNLYALYRDKMLLSTTYFGRAPQVSASIEERQAFFRRELPRIANQVPRICTKQNCDPYQNALVPFLVEASLNAAASGTPYSHIWYTHFGAPTAVLKPSTAEPFTSASRAAFELLAEAHYGITTTGASTAEPRVRVASTTTVMRYRKLASIVQGGLLDIDRKGNAIRIGGTIDPFLGGIFPAAGMEARDLANLTFAVNDVYASEVNVDGRPLTVTRKPTSAKGRPGEITIVDDTESRTLPLSGAAGQALQAGGNAGRTCVTPRQPFGLFNASHVLLSNPLHGAPGASRTGEMTVALRVRPHAQQAFGLGQAPAHWVVLTTDPAGIAASKDGEQLSVVVHTIDLPQDAAQQPAQLAVDLATPSRFLPGARPTPADLHVNGIVEEVCLSVANLSGAGPVELSALRFATPARSDRPASGPSPLLVGGRFRGANGSISLRHVDSGSQAVFTAGDGYFVGKVPQPGKYALSYANAACRKGLDHVILIEQDRLDLDLAVNELTCGLFLEVPQP